MKIQVWIGLVGVRPRPGNLMLEGAKGAYVNAVAFVSDARDYRQLVTQALQNADFDVFDMDDVEPFEVRRATYAVAEDITALADACEKDHKVSLGAFYPFTEDVKPRAAKVTHGHAIPRK